MWLLTTIKDDENLYRMPSKGSLFTKKPGNHSGYYLGRDTAVAALAEFEDDYESFMLKETGLLVGEEMVCCTPMGNCSWTRSKYRVEPFISLPMPNADCLEDILQSYCNDIKERTGELIQWCDSCKRKT